MCGPEPMPWHLYWRLIALTNYVTKLSIREESFNLASGLRWPCSSRCEVTAEFMELGAGGWDSSQLRGAGSRKTRNTSRHLISPTFPFYSARTPAHGMVLPTFRTRLSPPFSKASTAHTSNVTNSSASSLRPVESTISPSLKRLRGCQDGWGRVTWALQ